LRDVDVFEECENLALERLKQTPGLASIKTWDIGLREALYAEQELTHGFAPAELPALLISCSEDFATVAPFTSGELAYQVPLRVITIVRAQEKTTAQRTARALQWQVERVLHAARTNRAALSMRHLIVERMRVGRDVRKAANYWFGLGQIDATLQAIVPIEEA
jgi:hypothetical protein